MKMKRWCLTLLFVAASGTAGLLLAAKVWDPAPEISPPQITSPQPGTVVAPGTEVTCTCDEGSDLDTWTDGDEQGTDTDDMNREEFPHWYASGGSWKNDDNVGTQVTWVAPDDPGTCSLQVCDNDLPKEIGQGESGDRDDPFPGYSDEQEIHVADVESVTLLPFQQQWQGVNRQSDLQETGDSKMIFPGVPV